jgi:hypothetical protein
MTTTQEEVLDIITSGKYNVQNLGKVAVQLDEVLSLEETLKIIDELYKQGFLNITRWGDIEA